MNVDIEFICVSRSLTYLREAGLTTSQQKRLTTCHPQRTHLRWPSTEYEHSTLASVQREHGCWRSHLICDSG